VSLEHWRLSPRNSPQHPSNEVPHFERDKGGIHVIGLLVVVLVAALVYVLLAAITGSGVLALVGAIVVLLVGVGAEGGYSGRWRR
jgi:hypothetical protein